MSQFETVGLITKSEDARLHQALQALLAQLRRRGLRVLADDSVPRSALGDGVLAVDAQQLGADSDLIIALGGDGTLLAAARRLVDFGVPIMGISLGRLGFLVDISPEEVDIRLDEILTGSYLSEDRFLIESTLLRADGPQAEPTVAFNDVVLHSRDAVRMIEFETFIDDRFVNVQRADGLIVSTPTGSTAYALSGGGPIIHPELDAIVLVPICPHTLSNRPLVVGASAEIELRFSAHNRTPAQMSSDAQANLDVGPGDRLLIRRYPTAVTLIHPPDHDYFHILRAKLHWSEQP
jgi:NAD+ kinase